VSLFDIDPSVALPDPYEGLSAGQRLTLRQKTDVANGRHPLTGGPVLPDLGTCGACKHRRQNHRGYPKCWFGVELGSRPARSARTDVRAWWPACSNFEPADAAS
jgi:hypothetical protein